MTDSEIRSFMSHLGFAYTDVNLMGISSAIDNGEFVIGSIHNSKYYCHAVVIVGYFKDPGTINYYQCMDPCTGQFVTVSAEQIWSGSLLRFSSSNVYKSLNY